MSSVSNNGCHILLSSNLMTRSTISAGEEHGQQSAWLSDTQGKPAYSSSERVYRKKEVGGAEFAKARRLSCSAFLALLHPHVRRPGARQEPRIGANDSKRR